MTDHRELLARLTVHGPQMDVGSRSTALDRLTAADIGFALGFGLGRGDARLLLAKYCDDQSERKLFKAEFFSWVMGKAQDWQRPKPGMVYGLSYAAADEFLGANICPTCNGVHEIGTWKCPDCQDTPGYRYPSEVEYAKAMCVSAEIPNHQDILDRIHAHDVRLTRVETQQTSMAREITEQTSQLEKLREGLEKLGDKIEQLMVAYGSVDGRLKLVLVIIGLGVPAIIGLEIWAGLR
jgi:hypothetical protein